MDFLTTSGNFLLILFGFGFLIFVHELGHFLAARWANIRVDCFAIGMGPPILSWRRGVGFRVGSTDRDLVQRYRAIGARMSDAELAAHGIGETEYTLRLLPLGGYVRMVGQEDGNPSAVSDAPRSYQTCPIAKRMVVVSAGVVMNLITAVILFWIAFTVGVRFPAPVVGGAFAGSPAALAVATNAKAAGLPASAPPGLQPGDVVTAIDGSDVDTFADIVIAAAMSKPAAGDRTRGNDLTLLVSRPGVATPLEFTMAPTLDATDGLLKIGVGSGPALSPTITAVEESRADVMRVLANGGFDALHPGATLTSANGTPITTLDQFAWMLAHGDGSPVTTTWSIPGSAEPTTITITPQATLDAMNVRSGEETVAMSGLFGMTPLVRIEGTPPGSVNGEIFKPGDVVLRIGDIDAPNFADLRRAAKAAVTNPSGTSLPVTVLRDAKPTTLTAKVSAKGKLDVLVGWATDLPRIAQPITEEIPSAPATPAPQNGAKEDVRPTPTPIATLGLFAGSTVTEIAGTPVTDWFSMRAALRSATAAALAKGEGASVGITFALPLIESSKESKTLTLNAAEVASLHALGWRSPIPPTIFDPSYVTLKATGPMHATTMGFHETKKLVLQVYLTLDRLVRGSIGVDKLNGPVGIFHIGVQVADQGFMFLVFFVAMLSVNLAVMNFLPLPIVDGGLFLFLVYEKFVGRPPSIGFQNVATAVGLILIGSIFLITFYNDVVRLIG